MSEVIKVYDSKGHTVFKNYFPKIGGGIAEREELGRKDITHFEASKEIE